MSPTARNLLAVVAGVITNSVVVTAGESLTARWFLFPAISPGAPPDSFEAALRAMPSGAFGVILGVTLLGALLSGLVAGRLAAVPARVAIIIGGILAAVNTVNAFLIWHPLWFRLAALVLPGLLAWWVARRGGRVVG